jgi:TolB-like protein/DNA-binding winged helix-turn-helix (wHTH) protein/Tfp pilus assembly protein PilF
VRYRFGDFVLDVGRHLLLRGDREIVLPSRALTVLEDLVTHAPETVEKTTLLDMAWSDVAVVEDNLVQAIGAIRSALGDDSREPHFIQTVHRRGYRFIASVEPMVEGPSITDTPAPRDRWGLAPAWRRFALAACVAIVTGAIGIGLRGCRSRGPIDSLIVLPMTELSADATDSFFADGMTDALITELARYPELDVISRTSAMKYRNTNLTVPEIAREVGVDAVVEGTVTRAGGRIRVIAQLVAADDHHVWGESFEQPLEDILVLQRRVAESIADEIGGRLDLTVSTAATDRPQVQPEAHAAYLRGRHVVEERTESSLRRAVTLFEQAIAIEPEWAEPWLGLADATNLLANYGYRPSNEARPEARQAALNALERDPDLAEAYTALALVEAEFDWQFAAAEMHFKHALELNPSSATSHSWYGHFLVSQGRLDDALREMQRAHRLDPLSPIMEANIGWFHLYAGEIELAEERLRETISYEPGFGVTHYYLGILLSTQNRHAEARSELERAVEISGGADYARAALAFALARSGDLDAARSIQADLEQEARTRYVSPVSLVIAAVGLGDRDTAFAQLQRAYDERKGWLLHIRYDPTVADLRADPRFAELTRAIGLPE